MSKELEALEKLCDIALCDCSTNELNRVANYRNIIATALKRQDSIEITAIDIEQDNKALCKENKKLKRVLKIIKNKEVNVARLIFCESIEEYNSMTSTGRHLTQEEFDLLKEVLKDGK